MRRITPPIPERRQLAYYRAALRLMRQDFRFLQLRTAGALDDQRRVVRDIQDALVKVARR